MGEEEVSCYLFPSRPDLITDAEYRGIVSHFGLRLFMPERKPVHAVTLRALKCRGLEGEGQNECRGWKILISVLSVLKSIAHIHL